MRNIDVDDILLVIGISMAGTGIWFIYWPAALIIIGLTCVFLGIRGSRIRRK